MEKQQYCRIRPSIDNMCRLFKFCNHLQILYVKPKRQTFYYPDNIFDRFNDDPQELSEGYLLQINALMQEHIKEPYTPDEVNK